MITRLWRWLRQIELVDDARQAWRWFSMQAMFIALALQGAWALLGDEQKASLPHWLVTGFTLMLLAAGVAGRLVKQPPKARQCDHDG